MGNQQDIGLIDADLLDKGTRFPNLALMKLSSYYKSQGDNIDLIKYNQISDKDLVLISKVFNFTNLPDSIKDDADLLIDYYPNTRIRRGGTGINYDKKDFLSEDIEHTEPDYSLYNQYGTEGKYYSNHSIGFITRFCFRQCPFCVNRNKEKAVRWADIEEFNREEDDYIVLLDDNVLAHPDRIKILENLQDTGKPFEFKQGLDFRLINDKITHMLHNSKYSSEYIFAFDNINDKDKIINKMKIWREYDESIIKFYVLTAFSWEGKYNKSFWKQDIKNTFERIKILMQNRCLPYVMKYKKYENSPYRGMYITMARWTNQPSFVKKKSFREFCEANGKDSSSVRYMKNFEGDYPVIAGEYFDMKWEDFN